MSIFGFRGFQRSPVRLRCLFQNALRVLLSLVLIVQPVLVDLAYAQEVIIDPNGNVGSAPNITTSASGKTVVNIAKPNLGGVSLNQYTTFSPATGVVVLNNSATGTATQLAGSIQGNANLTSGTAATIVNEVTSSNSSSLKRAIEVAGSKANVIIANPNGLLCSGCSFINAGTVTLTTGVPVIDGSKVRLDVTKGAVTIGRGGLNGQAQGLSGVNLIGRTVVIDGRVTAVDSINVQAGAQGYDLSTGKRVLTLTGSDTPATNYAIDGTAFGAMEAGRIQIVGNDLGFGVRSLGALKSTTQGVTVNAQGGVTVASVSAKTDARVSSVNDGVMLTGDISALTGVAALTGRDVMAGAETGIFGFSGVSLSGSNTAALFGDIQSNGAVTVNGPLFFFGANVSTTGSVTFTSGGTATIDGATIVADSVAANAIRTSFVLANTAIFSAQDVQIGTASFSLGRDVIVDSLVAGATSKLIVQASGDFHNSADLRLHQSDLITYAGNLYNEASGIMQAQHLNISFARDIYNSGILLGDDSLALNVRAFFNKASGTVLSDAVSITTTGMLVNEGTIFSQGQLSLTAGTSLNNKGFLQGSNIALIAPTVLNGGSADVRASGTLVVNASTLFSNTGSSNTIGLTTVTTGQFTNAGSMISDAGIKAVTATILNQGSLVSGHLIDLSATSTVTNSGTIGSYDRIKLVSAVSVTNSGAITADGLLQIVGPLTANTGTAALLRAKSASILSGSVTNSGKVFLNDSFAGSFDLFQNDGVFASGGALILSGKDALSQAKFGAESTLISGLRPDDASQTLLAGMGTTLAFANYRFGVIKDPLTRQETKVSTIAAGGNIAISGPEILGISANLQAKNGWVLLAGDSISLSGGTVINAANLRLTATSGAANYGVIATTGYLQLAEKVLGAGFGTFTNDKLIDIGSTRIFSISGAFTNTGIFNAGGITIAAGSISNTGHMQSASGIGLTAQGQLTHSGTISAVGALNITADLTNLTAASFVAAANLNVTGSNFTNAGHVSLVSTATNTWILSGTVNQSGMTFAEGGVTINAATLGSAANSLLGSSRDIRITASGAVNLSGAQTANSFFLTSASLAGTASSDIFASKDILITTTGVAAHAGEIAANRNLKINAAAIDLAGSSFARGIELTSASTLISRGNVYSQGAIIAVSSGAFSNYGTFEAQTEINLTAASARNFATGEISSTAVIAALTGGFQNDGIVFAANRADITASGINNTAAAKIKAVSLTAAASGGFSNAGTIDLYGFSGVFGGAISNTGTISTKTYLGVEGASFSNAGAGNLLNEGHVYIKVTGAFTNATDRKISGDQIDIRAGSVSNAGLLTALNVVNIADVAGAISNTATGKIYSKTIALIAGTSVRNDGIIGSIRGTANPLADIVNISAATSIDNFGQMKSTSLRLIANGNITLRDGSSLETLELTGLKSNAGGVVNFGTITAGDLTSEVATVFDNQGRIAIGDTLSITAGGFRNLSGTLRADGTSRAALITANNMVFDLAGWVGGQAHNFTNNGSMEAINGIYVDSEKGSVTSTGTLHSSSLNISALLGITDLGDATVASKNLIVDARSVILRGNLNTTDLISLHSGLYDVDVGGRIMTKQLLIDAHRNILAGYHALRGSDLTQLVANDILRNDGETGLNQKLATIWGANKDIFVELRTGSLGSGGTAHTDITGYETARFNTLDSVAGSIALQATVGNIYLTGSLVAGDAVYVKSGNVTALQDITIRAGDFLDPTHRTSGVLHLEGANYLKKFDNVSFDATNKVELVQNLGSLSTASWLSGDIGYDLSVVANDITVDSDHRFIDHDIWLYAKRDIAQIDHVISARGITYTAGRNIKIEFNPFDWRAANPSATDIGGYWSAQSAGLRGATLASQGKGTLLYAGGDINLISGKITSYGDLTLVASGNITSQPIYLETGRTNRPGDVGWDFSSDYKGVLPGHDASLVTIKELRAYENQIAAGKNLTILAGGSATFIGSKLTAGTTNPAVGGDISIQAVNGRVSMIAAPGYWVYDYANSTSKWSWGTKTTTTVKVSGYEDIYKGTSLTADNGNIFIASTAAATANIDGSNQVFTSTGTEAFDAILSAGTKFSAQNITLSTLDTNRNILLGTYAEQSSLTSSITKTRNFLGLIKYSDNTSTSSTRYVFNTSNELLADDILTLASGRDLTIVGGILEGQKVYISAVGNLNIQAAINSKRESYFTEKTNLFTITTIQQGFDREEASLPQINGGTITFAIGGNTYISGYKGADLNSQLLNIVSTHDFANSLPALYSGTESATATTAANEVNDEYYSNYVLPTAIDGSQYAYLDKLLTNYGAQYETISLRDHSWYDKQVRLTPAFQALLSAVAAYVTGGTAASLFGSSIAGTPLAAGIDAAIANLTSGVVGGAITGDFDLDDVLRGAVLAGVSTTLTSFVSSKINLGDAFGASDASPFLSGAGTQFSPNAILDRLGDKVISTGISNVVYGRDFFDGFDQLGRTFLTTETMGVIQFGIGEIGNGMDHQWEGSLPHMLLHGGLGCVTMEVMDGNCASGFFAGVSQSVLVGSNLSDEQKAKLINLVGSAGAFLFADGQAINVSFGGTIAQSGLANNYLSHTEAALRAAARVKLKQCTTDNNCTASEVAEYRKLVATLDDSDKDRDEELMTACSSNQSSAACVANIQAAIIALGMYDPDAMNPNAAFDGPNLYRRIVAAYEAGGHGAFSGAPDEAQELELLTEYQQTYALLVQFPDAYETALDNFVYDAAATAVAAAIIGKFSPKFAKPSNLQNSNINSTQLGLTPRNTLVNLRPGDAVALESRAFRLVMVDGKYHLKTNTGQLYTPRGSYDFVTMPDGSIRVAKPNSNPDFSTHLGLSGGGEVKYAGSITFDNSRNITIWNNSSGHYLPPSTLAGNAGLPFNLFNPF